MEMVKVRGKTCHRVKYWNNFRGSKKKNRGALKRKHFFIVPDIFDGMKSGNYRVFIKQ